MDRGVLREEKGNEVKDKGAVIEPNVATNGSREAIFDEFRRWGYLEAELDPLGDFKPEAVPELQIGGEAADEARRIYCGSVGAEFMHIADGERRRWIAERMESPAAEPDRARILDRLVRSEIFEQVVQSRYLGTKRFSLEGLTSLIPLLDEALETAAERGAEEVLLGMSHRGRLSVMIHIVGRSAADIFARFEDVDARSVMGGGDVKYHIGATGQYQTREGKRIGIHLVSNPSHLEAVDPVALGRARAKQTRRGVDGAKQVLPILIHGDAAFAGQGIWAETLNFMGIEGFSVGGSLHIIVNNLIGFTATPKESHTSRFASDLAKRMDMPIFHVNAEGPDAVVRVARIAVEYRYAFASPVVIDLVGYRRYGHSEVDDPTITQPLRYRKIQQHPPLWKIYAERVGSDAAATVEEVKQEFESAQKQAAQLEKRPQMWQLPGYWSEFEGGPYKPEFEVDTGVPQEKLQEITAKLTSYPEGFAIHPKVKKLLEQRAAMASGKHPVDYGMAEALAFGSLLLEGVPVRLSGQDSKRGTFNQRHAALIDTETEREFIPLANLGPEQARFEAYNSALSEAGVMGFEYGYSRDFPETLVMWEAQFGDFANGAQVIIDQFVAAGEDKWHLHSGLVLLLPHGYEGQGPEHSSARIERFLQLAARDNIQVCQPSNAAQYFHLLRRQALRRWRKPLIVFTPKSMLRHPAAASPIANFSAPRFQTVLPDEEVREAERVLLCSGKIGHELAMERKRREDTTTAIVFLEQIYPFPEKELDAALSGYAQAREFVWVQEEPANMGARSFVMPRLERMLDGRRLRSVKRSASASPATGSAKAHELEQKTLLTLAFGTGKTQ
ncbi:MAG TPA: 2-oxoglutarate dehydrogenase E1 component [Candidatus Acidoferrales bacterium]|nr:2-oxoglutarate dehydrogenase E1 component [Candidatus Acidoferrales bacterium]